MVLAYVFGAVLAAVGCYFLWETWTYYEQYRTVSSVDPHERPTLVAGETVTLTGRVRVDNPAPEPDPRGDGETETASGTGTGTVGGTDAEPAIQTEAGTETAADERPDAGLVAWRIRRRKRKRSSSSNSGRRYKWTTEGGGLEVGAFEIESDAGPVAVDPDAARDLLPGGFGTADPWDSSGLHLGEPDIDARIDDSRDFGPDLPVDINLGPLSTGERSRFQVNRVADGDQVIVHGELADGPDGLVLTDSADTSLVIATGSVDDLTGRLRTKMAKNAFFAVILLVFAGASFGGYVDFS